MSRTARRPFGAKKLMTDKQLLKFATAFRKGMLGKRPSRLMCAMVSMPLSGLLSAHGVQTEVVRGELGHVYLRLADGRVLDPTADQFNDDGGPQLPPVYLGSPSTIHDHPTPSLPGED